MPLGSSVYMSIKLLTAGFMIRTLKYACVYICMQRFFQKINSGGRSHLSKIEGAELSQVEFSRAINQAHLSTDM